MSRPERPIAVDILTGSRETLVQKINDALQQGWYLLGPMVACPTGSTNFPIFSQMVCKYQPRTYRDTGPR